MENAGLQIFQALCARFPAPENERIVIVAGKGNNGGDGLVVARHLFNKGARPSVLLLAAKDEVRGDAGLNLSVARAVGVDVREVASPDAWKLQKKVLTEATIIVDAIFGTGLVKAAEGLYAHAIQDINKCRAFKLAVDIPSGLSSDCYELIGPAVKADLTVTLAAPKIAHVLPPAEEYVGELIIADISVPGRLFEDPALRLELVEKAAVLPAFQRRKNDTHKGTYGHVLVISGSLGKTGAAVMAARAALRTGAGLVTVATAEGCLPIIARSMAELMTEPLAQTPEKTIAAEAVPRAAHLAEGKDAILIGPGISTHPSTREFLWNLLPYLKGPVVVDADGLNILSLRPETLARLPKPAILTPHPGELARLLNLSTAEVLKRRLDLASSFASEYGVYLVLKGYRTLIASPDGRLYINPTGNPGMATGGSGDVLSGMLVSLLGQQKDPLLAALSGVYVHGLSGDLGACKISQKALVAGDLIRYLPAALKQLEDEAGGVN
jgi:NAD(P)H-hydrate epimerase